MRIIKKKNRQERKIRAWQNDFERVLFRRGVIQRRIKVLAARINRDYSGRRLLVVCVLKGSVVFFADLVRCLTVPCELEFVAVSSYGRKAVSSGSVRMLLDAQSSPGGRAVLIVEDILDTGRTLDFLAGHFKKRGAESIATCVLLEKKIQRAVSVCADYVGFSIPDVFVVGYGLDFCERYRHLPDIAILKKEVIEHEE